MNGFKKIILRVVEDENEFDIHAFIEDVTNTLADALSVDDPKVAARVLVDAAVGHWQKLGAHHQEISGHLQRADARVQHRGKKVLKTPEDADEDRTVLNVDGAERARKQADVEQNDRSGDPAEVEALADCRRDEWIETKKTASEAAPKPDGARMDASEPASLARIDVDGLKVVAGSAPGMPYRLHLLAPGGDVAKLLSGRGRPQDLELWLNTALRKLPDGYGWRLIGQSGELVSASKPARS